MDLLTGFLALNISSSSSSWSFFLVSASKSEEGRVAYCAILGFWDKEVDYCGLDSAPYGEDDVSLPSDLLK
jgi:hypothetical protein